MNLQEFLGHRDCCPVCNDNRLYMSFHSDRRQEHKFVEDRYLIMFEMYGINGQKTYIAGFSINPATNDFYIDFFSKDKKKLDRIVHLPLIKRFSEFIENLGTFRIYVNCASCCRYNYISEPIDLDFDTKKISDIQIESEYFGMFARIDSGYKTFRLLNYPSQQISKLICFNTDNIDACVVKHAVPYDASLFELPLIKFVSVSDTTSRIQKLLIFS
jgi:hypothetical protein